MFVACQLPNLDWSDKTDERVQIGCHCDWFEIYDLLLSRIARSRDGHWFGAGLTFAAPGKG
jgi:hypothetical protein